MSFPHLPNVAHECSLPTRKLSGLCFTVHCFNEVFQNQRIWKILQPVLVKVRAKAKFKSDSPFLADFLIGWKRDIYLCQLPVLDTERVCGEQIQNFIMYNYYRTATALSHIQRDMTDTLDEGRHKDGHGRESRCSNTLKGFFCCVRM